MMMGQSEALLDELASRARISDILLLYCRALDRCDVELMKSLYWVDDVDNHGVLNGGAAAFAESIVGETNNAFQPPVPAPGNLLNTVERDDDGAIRSSARRTRLGGQDQRHSAALLPRAGQVRRRADEIALLGGRRRQSRRFQWRRGRIRRIYRRRHETAL